MGAPYDFLLINPRSIYFTAASSGGAYLYAGLLSIGSLLDDRIEIIAEH